MDFLHEAHCEAKENIIPELVAVLRAAERLGLTFDRGSAYISAEYIKEQTSLRDRIAAAVARAEDFLSK
jgi:hypothetical protein